MHKNKLVTIKKRHEFIHAFHHGKRIHSASLILQFEKSQNLDQMSPCFGVTITKKLGKAVIRNKIKRRIKHLIRENFIAQARNGCNYVFIAKPAIKAKTFEELKSEFVTLVKRLRDS